MAAALSYLRRTSSTLAPALKRAPVAQTVTFTHRGYLCTTTTRRNPVSSQSGLSIATASSLSHEQRYQNHHRPQSLRWKSDDADTNSLRQWGFEDINASLPSETSPSPTHKPLILIDVREPAELTATGIIPSAVCIPLASQPDALYLTADEFETRFGFPKPSAGEGDVVFYCKAGVRARAAAQLAVQAGYDPARIGVYEGSWMDWESKGGRVKKWEEEDV